MKTKPLNTGDGRCTSYYKLFFNFLLENWLSLYATSNDFVVHQCNILYFS